ncbi:type III secretion system translocon subunit SctE [Chitinasiproducens palmae]|uniref:Secretion system effector C (SseC) like family protein n=1 Tax=Chitinasiproducens palmae TaxID=1770053 RepID=A0A1H2PJ24_9BURK|nr:type III secretion system translocon subunit SctE [Chitinasiproducens palmae]SDV46290.1 Secretion system effector C (SseC) like family protein [Chitinasiproducens palmae]
MTTSAGMAGSAAGAAAWRFAPWGSVGDALPGAMSALLAASGEGGTIVADEEARSTRAKVVAALRGAALSEGECPPCEGAASAPRAVAGAALAMPQLRAPRTGGARACGASDRLAPASVLHALARGEEADGAVCLQRLDAHHALTAAIGARAREAEACVDAVRDAAMRSLAAIREAGAGAVAARSGEQASLHRALLDAVAAVNRAVLGYRESIAQAAAAMVAPDRFLLDASESHAADLVLLMAQLSTLLRDAAVGDEQAHERTIKAVQESRVLRARRQAEDYARELEKARVAERTMGTVSKIVGIGMAIFGFIGALFTGGASLVVATAGLALTAADTIHEAVTGKSFLAEAFAPVMRQIGKWVQQAAKAIALECEKHGMSTAAAQAIGQLTACLAAIATVAAIAYGVMRGAGSKLVSQTLMRLGRPLLRGLQAAVGKAGLRPVLAQLRTCMRPVADAFARAQTRLLPATVNEVATFQRSVARWQIRAETLGAATSGAMSIGTGCVEARVGESESAMIRSRYELVEHGAFIRQTANDVGRRAALADSLARLLSDMLANDTAAKQAIARNFARV